MPIKISGSKKVLKIVMENLCVILYCLIRKAKWLERTLILIDIAADWYTNCKMYVKWRVFFTDLCDNLIDVNIK